jgi:hypothetical protein
MTGSLHPFRILDDEKLYSGFRELVLDINNDGTLERIESLYYGDFIKLRSLGKKMTHHQVKLDGMVIQR